MTDCCSERKDDTRIPRQYECPANGKTYFAVSPKTILHQIERPWSRKIKPQGYYYCDDVNCEIVYFGQDNSAILKSEIRHFYEKEKFLCYCFGITVDDVSKEPVTKRFVIEQKKAGGCACEARNPSGRCCLKDFPKA